MTPTVNTTLNLESLAELAAFQQTPCLSLYQPTHRASPDNQQDPIRFRNLVKRLEASLLQKHAAAETRDLIEPFEALGRDADFWGHTQDGLAVLAGAGLFRVFRLQRPVVELVVVADSFHTKPLRNFLQSVGGYQVLALSLHKVRLFQGNRDALDEIDAGPGLTRALTDAMDDEPAHPESAIDTPDPRGVAGTSTRASRGGKQDQVDVVAERRFRAIDRAVLDLHSRPSGLPLILAALPAHRHLFHLVSHNPFLMADGIDLNPDALTIDQLCQHAWEVAEPHYDARLLALTGEFSAAQAKGLGSDDMVQVVKAAAAGRVGTLLIEADRQIAGWLDSATGLVMAADPEDPRIDDALDDLGELVSKKGGRVLVIPGDRMPGRTGLSAIYRY